MSEIVGKKILCAIDIGTSKVVALVAELNEDEQINIIGIGTQPSKGLKKGVIVNINCGHNKHINVLLAHLLERHTFSLTTTFF